MIEKSLDLYERNGFTFTTKTQNAYSYSKKNLLTILLSVSKASSRTIPFTSLSFKFSYLLFVRLYGYVCLWSFRTGQIIYQRTENVQEVLHLPIWFLKMGLKNCVPSYKNDLGRKRSSIYVPSALSAKHGFLCLICISYSQLRKHDYQVEISALYPLC